MYLGTGTPSLAALMPNIMLKNDGGRRFLDVTDATGTGHLQKGHAIAFTDLDNDGARSHRNVGGAVPGDRYDDAVFPDPGGYGHNWISLKLVGVKTNRVASAHDPSHPCRRGRWFALAVPRGSERRLVRLVIALAADRARESLEDRSPRDLLAGQPHEPDLP